MGLAVSCVVTLLVGTCERSVAAVGSTSGVVSGINTGGGCVTIERGVVVITGRASSGNTTWNLVETLFHDN